MNKYYLFDNYNNLYTSSSADGGGYSYKLTCRETLIRSYARRIVNSDEATVFYFGHAVEGKVMDYTKLCNTIWKGEVPFEIIRLGDIKDCPNFEFNNFVNENPAIELIKIDRNVFSVDLSLILYVSWYGIAKYLNSGALTYYLGKLYTDFIPNTFTKEYGAYKLSQTTGYGPEGFMNNLMYTHPDQWAQLKELYNNYMEGTN